MAVRVDERQRPVADRLEVGGEVGQRRQGPVDGPSREDDPPLVVLRPDRGAHPGEFVDHPRHAGRRGHGRDAGDDRADDSAGLVDVGKLLESSLRIEPLEQDCGLRPFGLDDLDDDAGVGRCQERRDLAVACAVMVESLSASRRPVASRTGQTTAR